MPLVSVITVNLDNKRGLGRTLESLKNQEFRDFECIVVDGGSTDGSLDTIGAYSTLVKRSISEKDNGIYDAMNKGLRLAVGDFLLFLNSGDALVNDAVLSEAAAYLRASEADVLYGTPLLIDDKGIEVDAGIPDQLTLDFFLVATLNHQSAFIRRSLFERLGNYDTSLRYVADFEFWIRAMTRGNAKFEFLPVMVSLYNLDGVSSLKENMPAIMRERFLVLEGLFAEPTLRAVRSYMELKDDSFIELHRLYKADRAFRRALKMLFRIRLAPSAFKKRLKR